MEYRIVSDGKYYIIQKKEGFFSVWRDLHTPCPIKARVEEIKSFLEDYEARKKSGKKTKPI